MSLQKFTDLEIVDHQTLIYQLYYKFLNNVQSCFIYQLIKLTATILRYLEYFFLVDRVGGIDVGDVASDKVWWQCWRQLR